MVLPALFRRSIAYRGCSVFLIGAALLLSWTLSAKAASTAPMLTLRNGTTVVALTESQLAAMPQHRTNTATPWTDGVRQFEGPLMRDVLALSNASADNAASVTARALNDYEVDIDVGDFFTWDVILARTMDGEPLPRSQFGPLWIVYPRDQKKVLQDSRYDHRWAWQLSELRVNSKTKH